MLKVLTFLWHLLGSLVLAILCCVAATILIGILLTALDDLRGGGPDD